MGDGTTFLRREFGPASRDLTKDAGQAGIDGAVAALETFYYSLNAADLGVLTGTWAHDALVQLNNPVGGILRGREAITELYGRIFAGPLDVQVTFGDAVQYDLGAAVVFAGRETGDYRAGDGRRVGLSIRTTRVFAHLAGRWRQVHHHGSIDNADALRAYQHAALGISAT